MTLRKAGAAPSAFVYCDGGFGNEKHSEGRERPLSAETAAASIKDDSCAGQDSAGFQGSSARIGAGISQSWNRLLASFCGAAFSFNVEQQSVCVRCVGVCNDGPCLRGAGLIPIMAGCPCFQRTAGPIPPPGPWS